ncbi:hypothetical protein [Sphingobacterium mizutaii]|uniref:hypothetical protein n=1 Tax=Sphingobacterium mizutaii TaxID=1010 RepID=UPI001627AB25|nr:hypothetical protein [Sphingobacterium mizutaii]
MNRITAEIFEQNPGRYILVSGYTQGAPTCPYGNVQQWVGYDNKTQTYVRFSKSLYKRLVQKAEGKLKNNM